MGLLEVRRVSKVYQSNGAAVTALNDVSLEVDPGDFVALVGRSGCGKSTLLNLCGAVDFPTSGEVIIDGEVTAEMGDAALTRVRRTKTGFVFQSFQLLQTLTALENVELPLLLAGSTRNRKTALERLSWVGLEGYETRFPHQLSGGQQQRVAIARALVHEPRLVLADEPTGNLDTATGDTVLKLLRRTADTFGVAVIMATHSTESASVVDRTVCLRDGHVESVAVAK